MKDLLKKVFSNTTSNKRRILQQKLKSNLCFTFQSPEQKKQRASREKL